MRLIKKHILRFRTGGLDDKMVRFSLSETETPSSVCLQKLSHEVNNVIYLKYGPNPIEGFQLA